MQRNSPGAAARDGGPVLLRPVKATPRYMVTKGFQTVVRSAATKVNRI